MGKRARILLIYTGGTIGMVKDYETGALKAFNFDQLLQKIPEINQIDCVIDTVSFAAPIDSSNMNPSYWVEIVSIIEEGYHNFDGFVVLHGSDTMAYTASALSFMLENLRKPVILTGSQLPIGDLRTDAKENLITAIQIATLTEKNEPLLQEVALYFEYKLYRGNRTIKINAEHFEAFTSPNYPPLIESGVHLKAQHSFLYRVKNSKELRVHKAMNTNVAVLKLFPGINKNLLEAVVNTPDLRVLILETYGAGNATTDQWFLNTLKSAKSKGLHIVNVTQCSGGGVVMGHYEASTTLKALQLISGKDITTESAVTKGMYLLGQEVDPALFKSIFETAIRGEMSQN